MEIKAKFETNNINVSMEAQGAKGDTGNGVISGGTDGQVLAKDGSTDYVTKWLTLTKSLIGLGNVANVDTTTTTNVTEGANLYFTTARVLATVLADLSTATSTVITAADTVLSAIGKLQAQITTILSALISHTGNTSNPHSVTKSQVGLGNVDNTADTAKPVSTAQQTAIDAKLSKAGDTITGDIDNSGTGYLRLPNGTTAQRPASPVNGMRRYNTTTNRDEFYANGSWQNHASLSGDTFTGAIAATNLSGSNSGDVTIGTIDSQTKSSNGAVISGQSLVMQSADASNPGIITTTEQTFAGTKLFSHIGTTGTNASVASVWVPSNYGYKGWVCDPMYANSASAPTNGTSYIAKIWLPKSGQTITHAYMRTSVAGTSVTNSYCALYLSLGGSLLTQSDNRASAMGTSNTVMFTFTPQTINQNYVYVLFWTAGGTAAQFNRGAQTGAINDNLGTDYRYSTADTGLTTTAPATMGARTNSSFCWWIALD